MTLNIVNTLSNFTAKAPGITNGYIESSNTAEGFVLYVKEKLTMARKNENKVGVYMWKKTYTTQIEIKGLVNYNLTMGNAFSTSPIPNGMEIANYINKSLINLSLSFRISDIYTTIPKLSKASIIYRTLKNEATGMGIIDRLNNLLPTTLKQSINTLNDKAVRLNSYVSQALLAYKNINNALFDNRDKDSYTNSFVKFINDAINDRYLFSVFINGKLYTDLVLSKPSNLSNSNGYYNNQCNCQLLLKQIDTKNIDVSEMSF